MSRWNANPSAYANKLGTQIDYKRAVQKVSAYSSVALASAAASRYGSPLLYWLNVPYAGVIGAALGVIAVIGVLAILNTLSRWKDSSAKAKAQARLGPLQRKLLGLPPAPPPKLDALAPDATPAAARAATLLATPVGPAQRPLPLTPTGLSDTLGRHVSHTPTAAVTPGSAGRSSLGPSPGSRCAPWSGSRAIATPEQLRQYVDAFSRPGGVAAAADAAAGSPASPPPVGQLYYDQGDQGGATSPALPVGREAPAYRPSLLARKAATVGAAFTGDGLQPSAGAEAGRIMKDILQMEIPELLVWIERFREWFASQLLHPLAILMSTAHEEPNAVMARLVPNQQAPQLLPIRQLLDIDDDFADTDWVHGSAAGSGFGAQAGFGGSGGSGQIGFGGLGQLPRVQGQQGPGVSAVEDARNVAQNLMDNLQRSQLPYGYNPQPLLQALHRYNQLLLLLTSRRPTDLLPPASPSYIARRIKQLAKGTCVAAFNWNGGGEHDGRPWTPELPTDSALLFYLFAAFLDAPGWQFPQQSGSTESSRGAPLYLGSLRSRPPTRYSALLAFRPDRPGPGAVAVIGSNLASKEPRFSLLLGGQLVTLCERDGLFKVLLMWLQSHLVERQGLVGGRYLSDAALGGLEDVLAPVEITPTIPQRVFHWWFPPNK